MKTISQLFIITMLFTSSSITKVLADGEIHGRIMNAAKTEPLEFVSVVAMLNENVITSTTSDEHGYFSLKPLSPGSYTVKAVMLGFNTFQISEVSVNAERVTRLDIAMTSSISSLPTFEFKVYANPIFDPNQISTIQILETEVIKNSPYTNITDMVSTSAGVIQKEEGGEINVRGSRSDATQYVIDGVKASGPFRIPKNAIKEITVLTGGIPAMFGDATGGIIIITTKGFIGW